MDRDAVFGVKQSLIKDFVKQDAGTPTPDGRQVDGSWSRVLATKARTLQVIIGRQHLDDQHGSVPLPALM
jgi:hypothetical protein